MAWRDNIRPASFRGIPFGVLSAEKSAGRRVTVHEFPQREDVYAEDLGASPKSFTLEAFVIGPDYPARRDALEDALNQPGPGLLAHPWYGELWVSQNAPYTVSHSAQDGGMAVFSLSFVLAGPAAGPRIAVDAQTRAREKTHAAGQIACSAFDAAFKVAGQTLFVIEAALASVTSALGQAQAVLGGDKIQAAALLGIQPLLARGSRLWSIMRGFAPLPTREQAPLTLISWASLASAPVSAAADIPLGVSRARIASNDAAMNAFTRQIALVEASRALAGAMPESRSQAESLKNAYLDALDAVCMSTLGAAGSGVAALSGKSTPGELASPGMDALYAAILDARAASLAAFAENAQGAGEIRSFVAAASFPALVLAFRHGGGLAAEADLLARNRVAHPGFVPAGPLEALQGAANV